jgi:hypothetical protein
MRKGFKVALREVAFDAFKAREITCRNLAGVLFCTAIPKIREQLEDFVIQSAIAQGKLPPEAANKPEEIDWDDLLAFLKELLPLILEFIQALLVIF